MDSVTQAALGAVIGRAILPRAGAFPLFAGAVVATIPDFDSLLAPFISAVSSFVEHRSATHSLLLALPAAWLFSRLAGNWKLSRHEWFKLFFWCFITHILLDLCTVYGTQIFWPLSRQPFALSWLFIVDPIYTLPLLITAAACWLNRHGEINKQRRTATVVLVLTTLYIGAGGILSTKAEDAFLQSMRERGITAKVFSVQNAPLTIFQWKILAVNEDGDWSGWLSVFRLDDKPEWQFVKKIKEAEAVGKAAAINPDYKRLQSFSKGLYRLEKDDDGYYLTDLRFGEEGIRPFSFRVAEINTSGGIVAVTEIIGVERNSREALKLRWQEWWARF